MPILFQTQVHADAELGVWEISETNTELLSKLRLNAEEEQFYAGLHQGKRASQWLGSRVLLRQLLKATEYIDIRIDEDQKPYLHNFTHHFSISHSGLLAAVIISDKYLVGIDVEEVNPKIERIVHKFLCPEELAFIQPENRTEQLFACWSAKEALYKLYGKKGVSFRDHILLRPFFFYPSGQIEAILNLDDYSKVFIISYKIVKGHMLAWVID